MESDANHKGRCAQVVLKAPICIYGIDSEGTLDLLAYWRDSLTLFDFKTSHRPKRIQWLADAKLQIAAYRKAYQCLHGIEIPQGLIAVITPDTVQLFTLEEDNLESSWREWSLRLAEYQNFSLYEQLFAHKY